MITESDKMRLMHEGGRSYAAIAEVFRCSPSRVKYVVDPECRRKARERNAARNRAIRAGRQKALDAAPAAVQVYEGGDPWIEDRKVWSCGPSKRNGYKCAGKGGKQEPKPVKPKPVPVGIIAATDAHLRGDPDALAAYLRSVGRDSLAINTGDDDGTGLGRD